MSASTTLPGLTIRPLHESDYERVAELRNTFETLPVNADILRDWDSKWPKDGVRHRLVAQIDSKENGPVAGYGMLFRRPGERHGQYALRIFVDPAESGRGIGRLLYAELERFLKEVEATRVLSQVRDSCERCLCFAQRRGFRIDRHLFESTLSLSEFDPSPFAGVVKSAQASGIRFFTFADTGGTAEDRRRLWELNITTAQDVPGTESDMRETWPFEQFQKDVFDGHWFHADGQILAADGDRLIGLAAVGEMEPGHFFNCHTGVIEEFRGRGIATALKLLAIDCVKRHGGRVLRTNNDSANGPMVRVNEKLGYRPEPCWYQLVRDIE